MSDIVRYSDISPIMQDYNNRSMILCVVEAIDTMVVWNKLSFIIIGYIFKVIDVLQW